MNKIQVKFSKLEKDAICPTYGSDFAAGADLYSLIDAEIKPLDKFVVPTGIALEIPEGLVGLIYARSGLSCKRDLAPANKVGVIDSDYRGEIKVVLFNQGKEVQQIKKGERIAQIVFTPYFTANFVEDDLTSSNRGTGGFGSTGN